MSQDRRKLKRDALFILTVGSAIVLFFAFIAAPMLLLKTATVVLVVVGIGATVAQRRSWSKREKAMAVMGGGVALFAAAGALVLQPQSQAPLPCAWAEGRRVLQPVRSRRRVALPRECESLTPSSCLLYYKRHSPAGLVSPCEASGGSNPADGAAADASGNSPLLPCVTGESQLCPELAVGKVSEWVFLLIKLVLGAIVLALFLPLLLAGLRQVLPNFGLKSAEEYNEQCAATTEAELDKLRAHVHRVGGEYYTHNLSGGAQSRLGSFLNGYSGFYRKELHKWLLHARGHDEQDGDGFTIDDEGRRVDDDEGSELSEMSEGEAVGDEKRE